jgi:alpha-tubulin suppressor-like RCC1 family protein
MSNYISTTDGDFDRVYMTSNSLFNLYLANTAQANNPLYMAGTNFSVGSGIELPNSTLLISPTYSYNPILTDLKYGWKQVSIGNFSGAGIRGNGSLWAWGKFANGSNINANTAVIVNGSGGNTWVSTARADGFGFAINSQGHLYAWGQNTSFNLGDQTSSYRSSLIRIDSANTWTKISCGKSGYYPVSAIKQDGTLWSWGDNEFGQCGIGTGGFGAQTVSIRTPVASAEGQPANTWSDVAVGIYHTLAISSDPTTLGYVYSWGRSTNGSLGSLDFAGAAIGDKSVPTLIGTSNAGGYSPYITGATAVSVGTSTSAAIAYGVLWTWGTNSIGQAGDGTTSNRSSPVTVAGGGTTWSKVTHTGIQQFASNQLTFALKTDGTMWCWGYNNSGQAGDGTLNTAYSSPQLLTTWSGNTWYDISGGGTTFAAVRQY